MAGLLCGALRCDDLERDLRVAGLGGRVRDLRDHAPRHIAVGVDLEGSTCVPPGDFVGFTSSVGGTRRSAMASPSAVTPASQVARS